MELEVDEEGRVVKSSHFFEATLEMCECPNRHKLSPKINSRAFLSLENIKQKMKSNSRAHELIKNQLKLNVYQDS